MKNNLLIVIIWILLLNANIFSQIVNSDENINWLLGQNIEGYNEGDSFSLWDCTEVKEKIYDDFNGDGKQDLIFEFHDDCSYVNGYRLAFADLTDIDYTAKLYILSQGGQVVFERHDVDADGTSELFTKSGFGRGGYFTWLYSVVDFGENSTKYLFNDENNHSDGEEYFTEISFSFSDLYGDNKLEMIKLIEKKRRNFEDKLESVEKKEKIFELINGKYVERIGYGLLSIKVNQNNCDIIIDGIKYVTTKIDSLKLAARDNVKVILESPGFAKEILNIPVKENKLTDLRVNLTQNLSLLTPLIDTKDRSFPWENYYVKPSEPTFWETFPWWWFLSCSTAGIIGEITKTDETPYAVIGIGLGLAYGYIGQTSNENRMRKRLKEIAEDKAFALAERKRLEYENEVETINSKIEKDNDLRRLENKLIQSKREIKYRIEEGVWKILPL